MYLEGPLKSGKTAFLVQKFIGLIESGVSTSEILVITQNSYKKKVFSDKVREKLVENNILGTGELPVFTFNGIVYNSIKSNWPLVEEIIPDKAGNREINPNLCGLEVSELLIKSCIRKINQRENIEDSLRDYQSHKNLKHQILRRLTLVTNNMLDKSEISERSELLNEQMGKQAQDVLEELRLLSRNFRTFDYLKQMSTFHYLLEKDMINFGNIKYLLVDDFDEMTFSAQHFVRNILSGMKEFYISADAQGSSRRGYLCANPDGYTELKQLMRSETKILTPEKESFGDAQELFEAVLSNKTPNLKNITLLENSIRYVEMLEQVFCKIKVLISNEKYSPDDIVLVTPSLDSTLKHTLKEFFEAEKIKYQFLTGSKKIIDDPLVFGTLIILQLVNKEWGFRPKAYEIRALLTGMLGISTMFCEKVLKKYENTGKLDEEIELINSDADRRYKALVELIKELKEEEKPLFEQVEKVFYTLILPTLNEDTGLEEFNRMVDSLKDFELLGKKTQKQLFVGKEWLILMKDTVVSDNPSSAPELKENHVKIATPQKVIDLEIESKIQIWLDVSSLHWAKDDTGQLYNAWVFHKNWQEDKYTPHIHKKLTLRKTAHVLRKLVSLSEENIYCFASQLDVAGNENDGGIENYTSERKEKMEIKFEFTPRQDQAPVLEYESGSMAISAVPGAGKTKILEALIIKMIQDGINPEEILVLTYMDSAARNIRERIKNTCPSLVKFPHISTIHGLALSIIKQGDNYTKFGLDVDFDICDDAIKFSIMYELYDKVNINGDYNSNSFNYLYTSAISQAKLLEITPEDIGKFLSNKDSELYKELYDFYPVYSEYQKALKIRNMIDYDDFLIYSVKLLKEYPEIRQHYQEKFKFVIEDEAQDSSSVQQELFELICEQHGNLIRCGDPNQAITSSFSSSDLRGFVEFLKAADKVVEMDHSQRCATEVFGLANSLVEWTKEQPELKDAFIPLKIHPVEGRNPETQNCLDFKIYETPEEEKEKILKEIQKLRKSGFKFTIGVLLRGNSSVVEYAQYLDQHNIPLICYSESVAQKKVFRFIKAWLDSLNNPWNNSFVRNLYDEFCKSSVMEYDFDSSHFLEKAGSPFISFSKDDLLTENLKYFQDEILRWLDKSTLPPEEIVSDIGVYYFENVIDKSNARIISILVDRFRRYYTDNEQNKTAGLPEVIDYLQELGFKKKLSGVKFFNELEQDDDKYRFVQIMTAHKAKGLEFDAVFMPEMQETMYSYPITPEIIKPMQSDMLINQIKQIQGKHRSFDEIKLEQIHEHLRLIYVGITRAKHYLYMSGHQKSKYSWNRNKDYKPSAVLEYFVEQNEGAVR